MEHANAHFVLRSLLKAYTVLVIKVDNEAVTLDRTLMENVPLGSISTWAGCNKGCWVIVQSTQSFRE